jgi:hypothetical protein
MHRVEVHGHREGRSGSTVLLVLRIRFEKGPSLLTERNRVSLFGFAGPRGGSVAEKS